LKIEEVFIDLDGVLAHFSKRYDELFHEIPEENYPNESNNQKKNRYKSNFDLFVKGNNFATLDPMPDFHIAIPFINKISKKYLTYILSSTAKEEYLHELTRQKKEWLKKYDISLYAIFVPGARIKQYYSKPNRILIDDKLQTIHQWNANGGIGIHHKTWNQTIKEFNKIIKQ
jgi:hypothetical protein